MVAFVCPYRAENALSTPGKVVDCWARVCALQQWRQPEARNFLRQALLQWPGWLVPRPPPLVETFATKIFLTRF